ncbi:RtcB family protein [Niabella terrae]
MSKLTISGKELRAIGYPEGPVISVAMHTVQKNFKYSEKKQVLALLKKLLMTPEDYLADNCLGVIATRLVPEPASNEGAALSLNKAGISFNVFGAEHIGEGAMHQMYQAAKLPVAVAGALMPDAHHGYGLPIGGVLATDNAVIPYGVGVDIGCRMCLSIFDIPADQLGRREDFLVRELQAATLFGSGAQFDKATDHGIMEHPLFTEMPLLRKLHGRAWKQLGSSGSGNHFAEFGLVSIEAPDEKLAVTPGSYIGLLTHSGSRGLGAYIANHYTRVAISKRRLPQEAKNLAWLDLDESEGAEYWQAMNLAGDYASACHQVIHDKIARQLGRPLKRVENHHNFAWKEELEGRQVIVHRKGATPAGAGVLGIIPGSMTADGFIVKGRGLAAAVHSASHGAGRQMSRSQAMQRITEKQFRQELEKRGVRLLGGGLDESPFAYKDIHQVMESQKMLVDIVGRFTPRIVRMDGAPPKFR